MKKLKLTFIFVLMITLLTGAVALAEVMPRADIVFESATAFLSSHKSVVFDCVAYDIYDRISVTNVWLEQQIAGEWEYVKDLTPPSYVSENLPDYGAVCYYSADIGSGTFRVGFTVDADGYAISRYSNARTF